MSQSDDANKGANDIFVIGGFANAERTVTRLRDIRLFVNAIFIPAEFDAYGLGEGKLGCNDEARTMEALASYLESQAPMDDGGKDAESDAFLHYEHVFFSLPTLTTTYLAKHNPQARLTLYDDGYGSYYGNILEASGWTGRAPDELLVWFPGMCDTNISCPVRSMPGLNAHVSLRKSLTESVNEIFGYVPFRRTEVLPLSDLIAPTNQSSPKMFYMSQPINEGNLTENAADIVHKVLEAGHDAGMTVITKPHPRETPSSVITIDDAIMDERGLSLEVLCANAEICDDVLLVGMFSTSQYLPAMMFGKHPKLLFLYRLMSSDAEEIRHIDALVDEISATYGEHAGDKICAARSMDEVVAFLRRK